MSKKKDGRIVIDLLERHAEVPSAEAFRERYVATYAGRLVGRPAFVAPEPEPEPLPELAAEPAVEATMLVAEFQDDAVLAPIEAPAAEAVDAPAPDADALAAHGGADLAHGTISMGALDEPIDVHLPEDEAPEATRLLDAVADEPPPEATRLLDAIDDAPAPEAEESPEPAPASGTVGFEAVTAPEDVWGAPAAAPEPPPDEAGGTRVMGALPDADEEGDEAGGEGQPAAAGDAGQQGRRKKKRRHR